MTSPAARYFELCKPKVVALIVFTAVVGMFLATPGWPPLTALVAGTLGIALAASSAAAAWSRRSDKRGDKADVERLLISRAAPYDRSS